MTDDNMVEVELDEATYRAVLWICAVEKITPTELLMRAIEEKLAKRDD